jgi:spermidine synthase
VSDEPRWARAHTFLVSATVLFTELSLIRWLPANVYSLAFFSNLVLMAAFFGFGLGMLVGTRVQLFRWWGAYTLLFVVITTALRDFNVLIPSRSREWIWARYRGDQFSVSHYDLPLELVLVVLFFLVSGVFVPLGQRLATLLTKQRNLEFYQYDLLGSIAGIVAFTAASALSAPPAVWFAAIAVAGTIIAARISGRDALLTFISLVAVVVLVQWSSAGEIWSPYYSIRTAPTGHGFRVFVNRFYHQEAFDTSKRIVWGYNAPYAFLPAGDVLVVGAGTGNDVATALAHGARHVDAVEIDRAILKLGQDHPRHPYADPRVRAIVQDARTYLQNTPNRYDTIVFGTLDSHALLSSVSTVRLDNYVYTRESIAAARRCLKPHGLLAMLYSVPSERGQPWSWIAERLTGMVAQDFPPRHVISVRAPNDFLNLVVIALNGDAFGPNAERYIAGEPSKETIIPTDDWPFLYLQSNTIPRYYLITIVCVIAIGGALILLLMPRGRRVPDPTFAILGAAFLLLETVTVTRASLLFGSTWIVNSAVFFAILLMVLLANIAVRRREQNMSLAIVLISVSLFVYFGMPMERLLFAAWPVKLVALTLIAGLPIFFAGILFSRCFDAAADPQHAFGSNLIGTLAGGFCEYLSMITGFRALILLALALYLLAFLTMRRLLK